ncbi:MAG: acyl-CoA dehydrogenase [Verrucomicrobia bacterium]|jgi:acyl-CoA dehydrogenase|nr:acyl-CoA dehydrogenase [Verrucomicrobiota bacterium]
MDFRVPDKTRRLLSDLKDFITNEVYPLEQRFALGPFCEILPELDKLRKRVRQQGWWLPQIPEDHGGMGLGFMDHAMVSEVLGRSPLGHYVFNSQAPDAGNMEVLLEFGENAQREKWLNPLLQGKIRSCFSMTERDRPGSNPVWMETSAVRDGDNYVIKGQKWFTSSADGAAFAIVMAITNPDAEPHRRASQIIVPTETPGFHRVRNISCMGHEGSDWASHSEIRYEDCRVPVSNRIGGEGEGFAIAQARLGPGRIHHCMRWIGIAERAFEIMCRRAVDRELAPGEILGAKQSIQNWIAESRAEIDASRLLVLHAGWKIDAEGAKAARVDISVIKFTVAGMMLKVVDRAIQTLGALGISDDTILSYFYRNERAARIYDGADEVHKSVVARRILRNYQD